jgi:hypothetical protein
MKTISISDFHFEFSGYGHYKVTYVSPVTFKEFKTTINYMPLIDATKNCESPKIKDLNHLKQLCKS